MKDTIFGGVLGLLLGIALVSTYNTAQRRIHPPVPSIHIRQHEDGTRPPYFDVWSTCPEGFRVFEQAPLPQDGTTPWEEIQSYNVQVIQDGKCIK